ncbi:hypothetical protein BFG60_3863 [Microcystis aeruginosa NIES-98]|nr:hypothetical protein BFG60_3863 [Microcystis aeruginosa NIES-98]
MPIHGPEERKIVRPSGKSDRGKIFLDWSSQKIPVRLKLIIDRLCEESDPHDQ